MASGESPLERAGESCTISGARDSCFAFSPSLSVDPARPVSGWLPPPPIWSSSSSRALPCPLAVAVKGMTPLLLPEAVASHKPS